MNLAIIGAGELAGELVSLLKDDNPYKMTVIVDLEENQENNVISEEHFFSLPKENFEVLIAMGEPSMREKMSEKYGKRGYKPATFVHKSAFLGKNTKVLPGAMILPFVYIAQNVIIGRNSLIHVGAKLANDCVIGENCNISAGAFVGAKTTIGNSTFVGPNASMKDQIILGDNVIVGMGSNVIKNVDSDTVVVGNPAKKLRDNITRRVFR